MIVVGVLVFLSAVAIDSAHAVYVRAVADQSPIKAACASVAVYALGCLGWVALIKVGWWVAIPEVLGLAAGTYFTVRRQIKKPVIASIVDGF
jgi:hypothetical protein